MNPLMKNIIVLTAMISMIIPLMIYAQPFLTSLVKNTGRPTFYIYTGETSDHTYRIIIRVNGVSEEDTLYIYQININGKSLKEYDHNALINGEEPDAILPLKIGSNTNNIIVITLTRASAGQLIDLNIHTSVGTVFHTIEL